MIMIIVLISLTIRVICTLFEQFQNIPSSVQNVPPYPIGGSELRRHHRRRRKIAIIEGN